MSELARFHDQKSDEHFLQEMAEKHGINSYEYKSFLEEVEKNKARKDMGIFEKKEKHTGFGELTRKIFDVMKIVDAAILSSGSGAEKKEFAKQKQTAKELLRRMLEKTNVYIDSINKMGNVVKNKDEYTERKEYQDELETADKQRTMCHNALMDQVAIFSRYLTNHFGLLTDAQQELFEEQEEAADREVLDVNRQRLPNNLIWPDRIDIKKRTDITKWARVIADELRTLDYKDLGL
jgi:hypothetical protein